ncbi:DUF5057 domain-containing protein [Lachnospiraceae bacterium ZAX-1]
MKKKNFIRIGAVILVIALLANPFGGSIARAVSLPNVDKIAETIKGENPLETFHILEIVEEPQPGYLMDGQIGWYIGGQEPLRNELFLEMLKKAPDPGTLASFIADRNTKVETLADQYHSDAGPLKGTGTATMPSQWAYPWIDLVGAQIITLDDPEQFEVQDSSLNKTDVDPNARFTHRFDSAWAGYTQGWEIEYTDGTSEIIDSTGGMGPSYKRIHMGLGTHELTGGQLTLRAPGDVAGEYKVTANFTKIDIDAIDYTNPYTDPTNGIYYTMIDTDGDGIVDLDYASAGGAILSGLYVDSDLDSSPDLDGNGAPLLVMGIDGDLDGFVDEDLYGNLLIAKEITFPWGIYTDNQVDPSPSVPREYAYAGNGTGIDDPINNPNQLFDYTKTYYTVSNVVAYKADELIKLGDIGTLDDFASAVEIAQYYSVSAPVGAPAVVNGENSKFAYDPVTDALTWAGYFGGYEQPNDPKIIGDGGYKRIHTGLGDSDLAGAVLTFIPVNSSILDAYKVTAAFTEIDINHPVNGIYSTITGDPVDLNWGIYTDKNEGQVDADGNRLPPEYQYIEGGRIDLLRKYYAVSNVVPYYATDATVIAPGTATRTEPQFYAVSKPVFNDAINGKFTKFAEGWYEYDMTGSVTFDDIFDDGINDTIKYKEVRYAGGEITNLNWFQRDVFNVTNDVDEINHLNIKVTSKVAGDVTKDDVEKANLIVYVSGTVTDNDANNLILEKPLVVKKGVTIGTVLMATPGVHGKVYVYNDSSDLATLAFNTAIVPPDVANADYGEVIRTINRQNLYLETANHLPLTDRLAQVVTIATSIRHVINGSVGGENQKTELHILDIEPRLANSVVTTNRLTLSTVQTWLTGVATVVPYTAPLTEAQKAEYLANERIAVRIATMSTAQFVGKIDDLNETYDVIYFGNSKDGFNQANGNTDFVSNAMDGLLYFNIGDTYTGQSVATRLPGNDISTPKRLALEDFAKAGYPIIFADELLNGGTSGGVNANRVDQSTYLYALMNSVRGRGNVMGAGEIGGMQDVFVSYLNLSKPEIVMAQTDQPPVYVNLTSATNQGSTLSFKFKIKNTTDPTPVSTTYAVELFIDKDGSGYFVKDDVDRTKDERRRSLQVRTALGSVSASSLQAGPEYTLDCALPADDVGIIPWKLVVTKNDENGNTATNENRYIHASKVDFTRIRPAEKAQIKVLQLVGNPNSNWKRPTVLLEIDPQYTTLFTEQKNNGDFDVKVTTIGVDGMALPNHNPTYERYGTDGHGGAYTAAQINGTGGNVGIAQRTALWGTGSNPVAANTIDGIFGVLDKYDMLVLGFSDNNTLDQANLAQAIQRFANTGKSVLYTHDLAYNTSANYTSLLFNQYLRYQSGLDVYGVQRPAGTLVQTLPIRTAYTPKTTTVLPDTTNAQKRSYTTYYLEQSGGTALTWNRPGSRPTWDAGETAAWVTHAVARQNKGQITTYPYSIDNLNVGTTHAQYFNLNMEIEDLVVWYTLDKDNTFMPGDASGGYYLYSFGNIYYSGVGHRPVETYTDEAKLFVNTLIAAYRSKGANIEVTATTDDTQTVEQKYKYFVAERNETTADEVSRINDKEIHYNFVDTGTSSNYTAEYKYYLPGATINSEDGTSNATSLTTSPTVAVPAIPEPTNDILLTVPDEVLAALQENEYVTLVIRIIKDSGVSGYTTVELRKFGLLDLS